MGEKSEKDGGGAAFTKWVYQLGTCYWNILDEPKVVFIKHINIHDAW